MYGLIVYLGRFRSRKLWSWFIVGMNAFLIILYFTILLFCQIVMISVNIKSRGVRQTDSFILSQSIIKYKSGSSGPSPRRPKFTAEWKEVIQDFRKVFQYHTFRQMSCDQIKLYAKPYIKSRQGPGNGRSHFLRLKGPYRFPHQNFPNKIETLQNGKEDWKSSTF